MKGRGLALLIVGPAAPLLLILCFGWGSTLRWSGATYELAGLFTVAWQLNARTKAFGSSLLSGAGEWLHRILHRPQRIRPGLFTNANSFGDAEVRGYSDVEINGTLDDQLAAIKGRLRSITDAIVAHDKKMIDLEKDTARGFERERSEREKADADIRRQVEEVATGDIHVDVTGVFLIALGIILSAISGSFPN